MLNSRHVDRSVYRDFCKSKYFGDGSHFVDATSTFIVMLSSLRRQTAVNQLFHSTDFLLKQLGHLTTKVAAFSYDVTYKYLEHIENFLIDSQAMFAMIEEHNAAVNRQTYKELDYNPLFLPFNLDKPTDVIKRNEMWSENGGDEIEGITLLGVTSFYANKAAKVVQYVEDMIHERIGLKGSDPFYQETLDKFFCMPSVVKYIHSVTGKFDSELPNIIDSYAFMYNISNAIPTEFEGDRASSVMNSLADNPQLIECLINARIAKNALYNIKNVSTAQLFERCTTWNQENPESPIDYFLFPKDSSMFFNLPHMNKSIGLHLPANLYIHIDRNLRNLGLFSKVIDAPPGTISSPRALLTPLIDPEQIRRIRVLDEAGWNADNNNLNFMAKQIRRAEKEF